MKNPRNVRIDLEFEVGYVDYAENDETRSARSQRIGGREDGLIVVDFDARNEVLGIELLALDRDTIAIARSVAASHRLAFPRDLAGNLPEAAAAAAV